ncbi:MAG TPA: CHAT domain-containing protein, partial [Fimbriimonadaceae bacterium]|nr:CHAT domain-containing protein [Fimbriimonadaceae bacterium]
AALARRWIELTHSLHTPRPSPRAASRVGMGILATTQEHCYWIREGSAFGFGSRAELGERLKWLRYALFEPLSERLAPSNDVLKLLEQLRDVLAVVWDGRGRFVPIAPESEFWGAPWAALGNLTEPWQEPVICLAPGFGIGAESVRLPHSPKVVVWGAPRADLPQIEVEIEQVVRRFPSALWLRSAGEVREFLEGGEADLIHVAGHARLDPDKPMFSFLELEGGRIHATEIARSSMRTRLAVLSACDTGSLSSLNRFEPEGLVRAFLARGAEAAVASMWALDDEIAAKFAECFYKSLASGHIVGIAVSEARVTVRRDFAHPYFWAPMTLFGGYRP